MYSMNAFIGKLCVPGKGGKSVADNQDRATRTDLGRADGHLPGPLDAD
jgi:hypothetical protein